jgi:hypothetical protein
VTEIAIDPPSRSPSSPIAHAHRLRRVREPPDQLGPRGEVELPVDPGEMELHGLGADEERRPRLSVRLALGDLERDLELLGGELVTG